MIKTVNGGELVGCGDATFKYSIEVFSIFPTTGSNLGGTEITVTGNFFCASNLDNTIWFDFGDSVHVRLTPISSTATTLVAITPPRLPAITGPVSVVVQGKLIEDSVCTGICNFEYTEAATGTITTPTQTSAKNGDTITIAGTKFSGNTVNIVVLTPGIAPISATVVSDTSITFIVPDTLYLG